MWFTGELAENGIGDTNMTTPPGPPKEGDFVEQKKCVSSPQQRFAMNGSMILSGGDAAHALCMDGGGAVGGSPPTGPYPVHMWYVPHAVRRCCSQALVATSAERSNYPHATAHTLKRRADAVWSGPGADRSRAVTGSARSTSPPRRPGPTTRRPRPSSPAASASPPAPPATRISPRAPHPARPSSGPSRPPGRSSPRRAGA